MQERIARSVKHRHYFTCDMCGKHKISKMYEYKNISYVRGYDPPHYKKVCEVCIYRDVYGVKNFKRKKEEGSLE